MFAYYILIASNIVDDTMTVICHWHHEPSKEEVEEMWETYDDRSTSMWLLAKA
jgi:hypothetical protein